MLGECLGQQSAGVGLLLLLQTCVPSTPVPSVSSHALHASGLLMPGVMPNPVELICFLCVLLPEQPSRRLPALYHQCCNHQVLHTTISYFIHSLTARLPVAFGYRD